MVPLLEVCGALKCSHSVQYENNCTQLLHVIGTCSIFSCVWNKEVQSECSFKNLFISIEEFVHLLASLLHLYVLCQWSSEKTESLGTQTTAPQAGHPWAVCE